MRDWTLKDLSNITLAPHEATYEVKASTEIQESLKKSHPELFNFSAVSAGDKDGQCFFIPLDESSKDTALFIIEAVRYYAKLKLQGE